jgi:hypothetical protein
MFSSRNLVLPQLRDIPCRSAAERGLPRASGPPVSPLSLGLNLDIKSDSGGPRKMTGTRGLASVMLLLLFAAACHAYPALFVARIVGNTVPRISCMPGEHVACAWGRSASSATPSLPAAQAVPLVPSPFTGKRLHLAPGSGPHGRPWQRPHRPHQGRVSGPAPRASRARPARVPAAHPIRGVPRVRATPSAGAARIWGSLQTRQADWQQHAA